ncbi:hypothetical protein DFH05DRAFT_1458828 [Lentinula detonsa]|uniref:Fungal-type protein kinase domain-containing protein n=1 Tax=Lentinula detonsa TaxID=2804962 RepID=A0A9W8P429_9AGAR|nr:hypothetical protein DFH05DRAFT_1458828 [Lentinula detonsa]
MSYQSYRTGPYETHVMLGVIQEELQPLSYLKTAKECAQVFYDIFQWNIMVREKKGKIYGVLNDWDLAIWLNNERNGPTSLFRTGMKPYMAHEQQSVNWEGPHRYRHDMESMFYVMLLFICLYSQPNEKVPHLEENDYEYEEWHRRDDWFLRDKKSSVVTTALFTPPATPFFVGFFMWLTELQGHLCRGFFHLGDFTVEAAKQEASQPDKLPPFNLETLGGYFSHEQIAMILHIFNNEQLTTHGLEWQKILEALSQ